MRAGSCSIKIDAYVSSFGVARSRFHSTTPTVPAGFLALGYLDLPSVPATMRHIRAHSKHIFENVYTERASHQDHH